MSIARTLLGGQDLNYDFVTYHFYLGYSAFVDRFQLDYLPASFQGYQSPLPYALLYLLDSWNVPAPVNASIHASIHAVNLVMLYLLAERLVSAKAPGRTPMVTAFWLLGASAPIYWYLVGTSFADLVTSVGVLGGLWLVTRSLSTERVTTRHRILSLAMAGALIGSSTGLRVHNAIYVVGILCAVAVAVWKRQDRFAWLITLSAAVVAGWALAFMPWALRVYGEFGNPLFPFYNGVFRAPDFPPANLPLTSFVPQHPLELLTLPFRMATYTQWLYAETVLPDVRSGFLVLCAAGCALLWSCSRLGAKVRFVQFPVAARGADCASAVPARAILTFFAVSAALWLITSSNARYGVALFLLAGPVCGMLLSRLLPVRYVVLVVAGILIWQLLLEQLFFHQRRVSHMPWATRYFDWDLPDRLRHAPATVLSFGYQTASALAPSTHPQSRHANLVGQYTTNIDAAGNRRIRSMIADTRRPVYGVFDYRYTQQDVAGASSIRTYFREHLRLWGLDFDDEPCELARLKHDSTWTWLNSIAGIDGHKRRPPVYIVCRLRQATASDEEQAILKYQAFKITLSRLAAKCRDHLPEPLTYTRVHQRWIVSSFASLEVTFDFEDEGPFYIQQMRPPYVALKVGHVDQQVIVPATENCSLWFTELREISLKASRMGTRPAPRGE